MTERIAVSVIYVDATRDLEKWVDVDVDSTVDHAIRASGILDELPDGFVPAAVGIYGQTVDGARRVRSRDRIELYRPLAMDPKQARRKRAGR